jgi:CubicO group peptidase (beta-lactamase class C family)
MTSPTFPTSDDGTSFYGCGWAVTDDDSFAHSGSDGTFAWVSPELGSIVLVLTQTPDGDNPRAKFVEMVRMAITDDPAGS